MVKGLLAASLVAVSVAACSGLIGADWNGHPATDADAFVPGVDAPGSADTNDRPDTSVDGMSREASEAATDAGFDARIDASPPPEDAGDVYCSVDPQSQDCVCGLTAEYGTLAAPCGAAEVTPPVLCCATDGWPSASAGAMCSCYTMGCAQLDTETCGCQAGAGEAGVSCSTGTCCVYAGGAFGAQTCTCWTDFASCTEASMAVGDASPVASCTVPEVGCQDGFHAVTACR